MHLTTPYRNSSSIPLFPRDLPTRTPAARDSVAPRDLRGTTLPCRDAKRAVEN